MNSRTNKKRNKNTTQKLWMNAPHNKNKKNRYFSRLSNRRRRNNNDVFGDLAVPSLHDVTLKMHNVIDHADNAMLSFKPINYKRIHKRWKNKKYKVVSGGVGDAGEKLAEVKKNIGKLTGEVSGLSATIEEIEKKNTTPSVASNGDECLDSKERRTFSGRLQADNTVRISEDKPGTYPAFIEELAALGETATATADADDDEGGVVDGNVVKEVVKKAEVVKDITIVPDSATAATLVDAAAAAAAGAAGAAAAAALFTDDNSPATKMPTVTEKVDLSGEPLPWAELKTRWIKINAISNPKYQEEMDQNASSNINIKRQAVYDWLAPEQLDTTSKFHSNLKLYDAILAWLIKWDEFGGKIRTIVSIRGGQPSPSSVDAAAIPTIMVKTYNKTKVNFNYEKDNKEPDQIVRIRKSIGITAPEYGYFYTGFSSDDSNADRYTQGNFEDMITTLEGGGNVGIFGYGYSGSGKTYTLTNFDQGNADANGIAIKLIESLRTAKYTISLTVTELYCNKVKPDRSDKEKIVIDEKEKAPSYPGSFKNKPINSVPDFTQAIDAIKKIRVSGKRIKYTLNNPESSRGHLFYTFKLRKNGKNPGTLTICDMGGRENPIELSETSYMIIEDTNYNHKANTRELMNAKGDITRNACPNESYVGKIAERISNDMLRFYVKDPADSNKWLTNTDTNNMTFQHVKLEFKPDETDTYGNRVGKNAKRITGAFIKDSETSHCDSLLKSTFGSFFTSSQEITEASVRARLNIKEGKKDPGLRADEDQRVKKITESLNTFIVCCKEGIYINETINHLVAYVNFLSNVGEYLNSVEVDKAVIPLNEPVTGYKAVQAVYHPERHMYDPRSFIKSQYSNNLKTIMADQPKFNSITDSTDDTVGIISKLKDIKNPTTDETNPSMLCFIACINYDNSQLKNKIATRNTLEFAMSVSASNGPPKKMDDTLPIKIPAPKVTFPEPAVSEGINFFTVKERIENGAKKLDPILKKLGQNKYDDKIDAIIKFVYNTDTDESEYADILNRPPNKVTLAARPGIIDAFIIHYVPTMLSKSTNKYVKHKELISKLNLNKKLGGSGAKVRTRKRKSRREKKNRITRRRNRV